MHALIIEDEPFISLAIQDVLADNGCTSFDLVSSFDAAVAAATRRCPDLITADVRLAPGNGVDAVEAICAAKPIPVIFVTGSGAEPRERCPDHIVIDKPFTVAQIAEAVRKLTQPGSWGVRNT
ncbi:MAG TPA: response regulator [Allosphingosinicella sp.]